MSSSHRAVTRRTLHQLTLPQLRTKAQELGLPTTGRKSALVDRIYRRVGDANRPQPTVPVTQAPQNTPSRPHPPQEESDTAELERTVQRLVDHSLHGMEDRLLRALRPHAATHADPGNISLPSPTGGPPLPPDTAPADEDTAGRSHSFAPDGSVTSDPALPTPTRQPPVPAKVRQRILRGEFIDFDSLLPDALFPTRHGTSPAPSFSLRLSQDPSADGEMVIAQQKHTNRRSVCDLPSWMEAWNVYIAVLVAHDPARALPLLAYQRIICDASRHFPPRAWLRYDARFRACAAEDRALRWDSKHNDLWLECFTQTSQASLASSASLASPGNSSKTSSGRRPCTYCGSLYHYPDNCTMNPFRAPRRPPVPHAPTKPPTPPTTSASYTTNSITQFPTPGSAAGQATQHLCRDFNFNRNSCQRSNCRFRHVCSACGDHSHGQRDCNRAPPRHTPN